MEEVGVVTVLFVCGNSTHVINKLFIVDVEPHPESNKWYQACDFGVFKPERFFIPRELLVPLNLGRPLWDTGRYWEVASL